MACGFPSGLYDKNYKAKIGSFGTPPTRNSGMWLIQKPWRYTVVKELELQWRVDFGSAFAGGGATPKDFVYRMEKSIEMAADAQKPVSQFVRPLFDEWYSWFLVTVPFQKVFGRNPNDIERESWCGRGYQSQVSAEAAMRAKKDEILAAAEKAKADEAARLEAERKLAEENAAKRKAAEEERARLITEREDRLARERAEAEAAQRKTTEEKKRQEDAAGNEQKAGQTKTIFGVLAVAAVGVAALLKMRR